MRTNFQLPTLKQLLIRRAQWAVSILSEADVVPEKRYQNDIPSILFISLPFFPACSCSRCFPSAISLVLCSELTDVLVTCVEWTYTKVVAPSWHSGVLGRDAHWLRWWTFCLLLACWMKIWLCISAVRIVFFSLRIESNSYCWSQKSPVVT